MKILLYHLYRSYNQFDSFFIFPKKFFSLFYINTRGILYGNEKYRWLFKKIFEHFEKQAVGYKKIVVPIHHRFWRALGFM
jgi:hypothetical protein